MTRGSDIDVGERFALSGDFLAGRLREHLSQDDLQYLENLMEGPQHYKAGDTLIARGERAEVSILLMEGYMFRTIQNGDRRYIVGIHVPGDFVDLHGFALKRLDHSVVAVGRVKVATVKHEKLAQLMQDRPVLARAMWFATLLDAAIHRKWIQMLEQLDAPRRIAHIYCELQERLRFTGRAASHAVRTPFTQLDLGDMCGISAVHANRAVSKLREIELAEIRRGTLYTNDWDALQKYAQFDASYLFGDGPLKVREGWG